MGYIIAALWIIGLVWLIIYFSRKMIEARSGFCSTEPETNESRHNRYENRVNDYVAGMDDADAEDFNREFEQRRIKGADYQKSLSLE